MTYDIQSIANSFTGGLAGGVLTGALIGTIILVYLAIFVVFWIYTSFAWREIAKKLRYDKDYLAWIPFARSAMVFEMGGFHWALVFLWLIPFFGWIAVFVIGIISSWRIYEKRRYPGWFSLAPIVPQLGGILYLVILGFVAWKDLKKPLFK